MLVKGLSGLSDLLMTFRTEVELKINDLFLIPPVKFEILGWLKCGFRADWAAKMPKNYKSCPEFSKICCRVSGPS